MARLSRRARALAHPIALIDVTIGRIQLGARNEANHSMLRVWCASLVGDLEQAHRELCDFAGVQDCKDGEP